MNLVDTASASLLAPAGLAVSDLSDLLGLCMTPSIDEADIYFQNAWHEAWVLEDGIIREGSFNRDQGVGIRAISGEKTGFAYSDQIVKSALESAAMNARAIARSHQNGTAPVLNQPNAVNSLYPERSPLDSLNENEKIDLLRALDAEARRTDERVSQVTVSLSGLYENVLVAASDGTLAADVRPLVRLNVSVIVEHQGRREQGSAGGGGRSDYRFFLEEDRGLSYAQEAVRQALVNLEAVDAPAGVMDVVLGPGWPGVLLHEAVGHGLEGDFNRKGSSAFSGLMGEQVAAKGVTVVDDGTSEGRLPPLSIDDDGTQTICTTFIIDDVLVGPM